jgi:hypothetical protein
MSRKDSFSAASRVPRMKLIKGENRFTKSSKVSLKLRSWSLQSAATKGEIQADQKINRNWLRAQLPEQGAHLSAMIGLVVN